MSVVKPEDAYEQWKAAILDKPVPSPNETKPVEDSSYILDAPVITTNASPEPVIADVKCSDLPDVMIGSSRMIIEDRPIIKLKKKGNKDVSKEI